MKYVVDANIHPQLKEPINILFRTSTFVPVNIPLCFFLSILPPTPVNQIFAQSLNQTYNFMFNYCNRNATNTFSNSMLASIYFYFELIKLPTPAQWAQLSLEVWELHGFSRRWMLLQYFWGHARCLEFGLRTALTCSSHVSQTSLRE